MKTKKRTPPALTLHQPWGWAILHLAKDVENRSWSTNYRGLLFIHQGKTMDPWGPPVEPHMPRRDLANATGILGWVQLSGCHQQQAGCCQSSWGAPDLWHWELTDPRPLQDPIEARGMQGLWTPPPPVLDEIRAAFRKGPS